MRGSGRIYRRGRIWWIDYWIRGRNHRESSHSQQATAARALLRRRLLDLAPAPRPSLTVGDILSALEAHYLANRFRSLRTLRAHLKPVRAAFEKFSVSELCGAVLLAYQQARQANGAAPATVNRELAALRRACSLARGRGDLSTVPTVPLLREAPPRRGFFSHNEIRGLITAVEEEVIKDFVEWAYWTGMRRSEIERLTWPMLDREERVLRLDGKCGRRVLAVAGPLESILARRQVEAHPESPLIFHRQGKPIRSFRRAWARACELAGVPGRLFHDLRRTGVRNLIRAGVDRRVAMDISGHKTTSVFDRYNITDSDDLRDAMHKLVQFFDADPNNSRTK